MKTLNEILWPLRLKLAIRKADRMASANPGRRYMVVMIQGRPQVVDRRCVKRQIARGMFRSGVRIADFDKRAIYRTVKAQ